MTTLSRNGQSSMEVDSPAPSDTDDDDALESEDEALSRSKQYKENRNKLNWLLMREKQIKVAIYYEKCRKSVAFIKNSNVLQKRISESKIELEEVKNNKRCEDLLRSQQQITGVLQRIVGPKRTKDQQSRYSEYQIKCITDLLQKKQMLTKQRNLKQKEIVSLEEEMEKLQNHNIDLKGKKSGKKGDPPHTNGKKSKNLEEINRLATRNHLLAKTMHSLSKLYMSTEHPNKNLLPVVSASNLVMKSQLDDVDEIHDFIYMIHSLKC